MTDPKTPDELRARADAIVEDINRAADEALAAAKEEGRREGLREAAGIVRSKRLWPYHSHESWNDVCGDFANFIESRLTPPSGTAERPLTEAEQRVMAKALRTSAAEREPGNGE